MTQDEAYRKIADEAEAMSQIARSQEVREAMRNLSLRWRELAETGARAAGPAASHLDGGGAP